MNKKSQGNKEETIFQREKEEKSIRNQERCNRTAKKHRETER
jgi:hypothetical protein